jgi:hypothetical protein
MNHPPLETKSSAKADGTQKNGLKPSTLDSLYSSFSYMKRIRLSSITRSSCSFLGVMCVIPKTKNCSESYQTNRVNLILCHLKKLAALFV